MGILLQVLQIVLALAGLACFILVVVKMFQAGDTGLGIACVVLVFVCGIGALVAFVMGWVKSSQYNIKNVMLAWTGIVVINLILGAGSIASQFSAIMNQ